LLESSAWNHGAAVDGEDTTVFKGFDAEDGRRGCVETVEPNSGATMVSWDATEPPESTRENWDAGIGLVRSSYARRYCSASFVVVMTGTAGACTYAPVPLAPTSIGAAIAPLSTAEMMPPSLPTPPDPTLWPCEERRPGPWPAYGVKSAGSAFGLRALPRRAKMHKSAAATSRAMAPPAAMPAIAPVDKEDLEEVPAPWAPDPDGCPLDDDEPPLFPLLLPAPLLLFPED
jgi:hypothetical protein